MQLIFLPDGGYFFDSTIRTHWTPNFDPSVKAILNGTAVEKVLWLETTAQLNGRIASFLAYRDTEGEVRFYHSLQKTHPKLASWIKRIPRDQTESLQVFLGPERQFLALSEAGHRWYGVTEDFQEDIQSMMPGSHGGGPWKDGFTLAGARFGVGGSYVILCAGGKHLKMSPNLRDYYASFYDAVYEHFHNKPDACGYEYITLNPYATDEWLIVWNDGELDYSVPPQFSAMAPAVEEWLGTRDVAGASSRTSVPSVAGSASGSVSASRSRPPSPALPPSNAAESPVLSDSDRSPPKPPASVPPPASSSSASAPSTSDTRRSTSGFGQSGVPPASKTQRPGSGGLPPSASSPSASAPPTSSTPRSTSGFGQSGVPPATKTQRPGSGGVPPPASSPSASAPSERSTRRSTSGFGQSGVPPVSTTRRRSSGLASPLDAHLLQAQMRHHANGKQLLGAVKLAAKLAEGVSNGSGGNAQGLTGMGLFGTGVPTGGSVPVDPSSMLNAMGLPVDPSGVLNAMGLPVDPSGVLDGLGIGPGAVAMQVANGNCSVM